MQNSTFCPKSLRSDAHVPLGTFRFGAHFSGKLHYSACVIEEVESYE